LFHGLITGEAAEAWFRWVEWILVSTALYALGVFAESHLIKVMAYFSAFLTAMFAVNRIADFVMKYYQAAGVLKPWLRITAIVVSAAVQVWLFNSIGRVLGAALSAKLP
jgi:hypothetical protein